MDQSPILTNTIEVSATILSLEDWTEGADYEQTLANVAGQLAESSAQVYLSEARLFAEWLREHGYTALSREAIIAYHKHLRAYKPNTAARKWSAMKQIVGEHIIRHDLPDLMRGIRGFQREDTSDVHIALTDEEVRQLLAQPDRTTKLGMRDYTLLRLLIRLALRRKEAATLTLGAMQMESGHHILFVRGKRNRLRKLKLPVDVWRTIIDFHVMLGTVDVPTNEEGQRLYEQATWQVPLTYPILVGFDKGDRPTPHPIVGDTVYRQVRQYAKQAGIARMTAHSTRASSITLMLERDVPLWMVQEFAGHSDPRTTLRYKKRKNSLDHSAGNVLDY